MKPHRNWRGFVLSVQFFGFVMRDQLWQVLQSFTVPAPEIVEGAVRQPLFSKMPAKIRKQTFASLQAPASTALGCPRISAICEIAVSRVDICFIENSANQVHGRPGTKWLFAVRHIGFP